MSQVSVDALVARGLEFHRAGRVGEAEALYRAALGREPGHAEALNFLGVIKYSSRQFVEAWDLLRRAVEAMETYPDAHNNLALVLREMGKNEEAVKEFRRAIEIREEYPEAHYNLGQALIAMEDRVGARACFQRAVELNPQYAAAWNNLGTLLMDDRLIKEAVAAFRAAVASQPNFAEALSSLCAALTEAGSVEEAIKVGREGLALQPQNPEAYMNLSGAVQALGKVQESIDLLRQAVAIDPQDAEARWDLSMALLLDGQLEEGWKEYEWRWKTEDLGDKPRDFAQPFWRGENIAGKTILVYQEQGFGDAIQFVRYVPLIAQRGAKVVVECSPLTVRLYETLPGEFRLLRPGESIQASEFDFHCSFMSFPAAFNTALETIPNNVPYVSAQGADVERFRARLEALAKPGARRMLNVGLVWAGNPKHLNDVNRSVAPWLLEPLKKVGGVRWMSLQKSLPGRKDAKLPLPVTDWTGEFNDYADTAGLIANLDLVIAVDTSVAHLAGAMGKTVWLLLPFAPDYRWMVGREDSPWYPTMKLYRQTTRGDWAAVIKRVRGDLEKWVEGKRQ